MVVWICLRGGEKTRIMLLEQLLLEVGGKKTCLSLREGKVVALGAQDMVVEGDLSHEAKLLEAGIQGTGQVSHEVVAIRAHGIKALHMEGQGRSAYQSGSAVRASQIDTSTRLVSLHRGIHA